MYGDIEVCSSLDGVINTSQTFSLLSQQSEAVCPSFGRLEHGLVFSYVYQQHVSVLELNNSSLSSQVFFLFF